MPTRNVGTWNNETVVAELDYNAQDQVTGVRVINNGALDTYLEVEQISNGRKYGGLFLAGTTTTIPVGTAAGVRIEQFQDARGFWDGLSIRCLIPAP